MSHAGSVTTLGETSAMLIAERPAAVKLQARTALPRRIVGHNVGWSDKPLHGTFRHSVKPAARAWLPGRRAR